VLQEFVAFWRKLTHPLAAILDAIIPFHLPLWYHDVYIISFILAVSSNRLFIEEFKDDELFREKVKLSRLAKNAMMYFGAAISSFLFLGVLGFVWSVLVYGVSFYAPKEMVEQSFEGDALFRAGYRHAEQIFAVFIATLSFFSLNYLLK
jgi:hypothetical protein